MQARHPWRALVRRGLAAAITDLGLVIGAYPLLPHAVFAVARRKPLLRTLAHELAVATGTALARPLGFASLPGHNVAGPRPIILVHGLLMSRAAFWLLARRLASAGLGPVYGFEYWTLGNMGAAATELGTFVDEVCRETGATQVDVIGHSMGGLVGRYLVSLQGGDEKVRQLITVGTPHTAANIGLAKIVGSSAKLAKLLARLEAASPGTTRITTIWSRGDALIPGEPPDDGHSEHVAYDDLGHMSLLASRRVAADIIARLRP